MVEPITKAVASGRLWRVLLLAFVAMLANDMANTVMVVFEAHYDAVLAGLFDVIGWIFGLVCAALAIESIVREGWRNRKSVAIILVISVANFVGTLVGVAIASAITHH